MEDLRLKTQQGFRKSFQTGELAQGMAAQTKAKEIEEPQKTAQGKSGDSAPPPAAAAAAAPPPPPGIAAQAKATEMEDLRLKTAQGFRKTLQSGGLATGLAGCQAKAKEKRENLRLKAQQGFKKSLALGILGTLLAGCQAKVAAPAQAAELVRRGSKDISRGASKGSSRRSSKEIPSETVAEWREAFDIMDKSKTGKISVNDISQFLEQLGLGSDHQEAEAKDIIGSVTGGDPSKEVDFDSFCSMMRDWVGLSKAVPEDSIRAAFELVDADRDGLIGKEELLDLLQSVFGDMPQDEIDSMLAVANLPEGGKLDLAGFQKLILDDDG